MSAEDTTRKISVIFGIQHDLRNPISGVHVSLGSAETLVRRGGIANHRLIAYSLRTATTLPKITKNRLVCVEVIVCYISIVFFETQCSSYYETLVGDAISYMYDLSVSSCEM